MVEYRKKFSLKQISYCYLAKVIGAKGNPSFTQEELDDGFEVSWLPLKRAIEVLSSDKPIVYEGGFIVVRDKAFLEAVKST